MVIIDTTTRIQINTAVFTLVLMLIPWAFMDLEINMLWGNAGVTSATKHWLSTHDKAYIVYGVKLIKLGLQVVIIIIN